MRTTRWSILVAAATVLAACSAGTAPVAVPEPPPAAAPADQAELTIAPPAADAPPPLAGLEPAVPQLPALAPGELPAPAEDDPIFAGVARPAAASPAAGPAPAGQVRAASGPLRGNPRPTGRIEIPAIGLNHQTYEGIDLATIDHGPSHWPGTPMPGQVGNTVFPGHRTTHSRPFWDLDRLRPGNEVIFTTDAGRFTYRVRETLIVDDSAVWVVNNTPDATFTLTACHPKGSARQRIVVKGTMVSAPPPPPPAPAPIAPAPGSPGRHKPFLGLF